MSKPTFGKKNQNVVGPTKCLTLIENNNNNNKNNNNKINNEQTNKKLTCLAFPQKNSGVGPGMLLSIRTFFLNFRYFRTILSIK